MRSSSRAYNAWTQMKQRCFNTKLPSYKLWGGRGITVCERWKTSFKNFLADMGECPPGLSLDRINNDGDYDPDNCRWTTKKVQGRNTRKCRFLEYKGERKTVSEWAEVVGITRTALSRRLKRNLSPDLLFRKEKTYRKKRGLKRPIKDMPCVNLEGRWYALSE